MNASSKATGSAEVRVTQHACERARSRLHWTAASLTRMAARALEHGLNPSSAKGMAKFLLLGKMDPALRSCPFIYGENVYVFSVDDTGDVLSLMTIYRAEHALLRVLLNKPARKGLNPTYSGAN